MITFRCDLLILLAPLTLQMLILQQVYSFIQQSFRCYILNRFHFFAQQELELLYRYCHLL